MPVAKGKKKTKRERRRFGAASPPTTQDDVPQAASDPSRQAKPARRRGWQGPLWLNVLLGVIMVVGGVVFSAIQKGGILILAAYWAVGGFYLYRAYRQYQEKRASQ
jgi:hypothetical protein